MSQEKKTLEASDPVAPDVLGKFDELDTARYEIGAQLLSIEQERVRLLAAAHQVDQQRLRLFEKTLTERGLSPSTRVQIDSKTGLITVLESPQSAVASAS